MLICAGLVFSENCLVSEMTSLTERIERLELKAEKRLLELRLTERNRIIYLLHQGAPASDDEELKSLIF